MNTIIVGFSSSTKGFAPFGRAIQLWDGTDYSHVYFEFRSEKYKVDMIYQASSTMLNYTAKEVFLLNNKVEHEVVLQLTDVQYYELMHQCMTSAGKHYGTKQLFGIVIADVLDLDKNIFANNEQCHCSEWVAERLELLGYKFDKCLDLVKPSDVFKVLKDQKL